MRTKEKIISLFDSGLLPLGSLLGSFATVCLLLSLLPGVVFAVNYTAKTCGRADVQSALDAASDGDTVIVPAGRCTWDAMISVKSIVRLQGAGQGTTNITNGISTISYLVTYSPTNSTANYLFEISGFTFSLGANRGLFINQTENTTQELKQTRIHHNTFTSATYSPIDIKANFKSAVVDNNIFNGYVGLQIVGTDAAAWNNLTYMFGNGDGLYLEDNVYNMTLPAVANDGARGSRWVNRYNTYILTGSGSYSNFWDMHGNQPSATGSMSGEIYGNNIIDSGAKMPGLLGQRGGKALSFYNYSSAGRGDYSGVWVRNEYPDTVSPVENPAGQPQYTSDSYFWSNYNASTLLPTQFEFFIGTASRGGSNYVDVSGANLSNICSPGSCETTAYSAKVVGGAGTGQQRIIYSMSGERITAKTGWSVIPDTSSTIRVVSDGYNEFDENNGFWTMRQGVFDGSGDFSSGGGVGCGTLANRPATCTTGVGYWATNQSCSNLSDMVGVAPSTPISGTLYKCTAPNTWTAYYTPYTYPHPLRTGGGVTLSPPTLKIVQ